MESQEREPVPYQPVESSMEENKMSPEENYYHWNMQELLDNNTDIEDKAALLEKFWHDRSSLFKGAEHDFDHFLAELRQTEYSDNSQLAAFTAQKLVALRDKNFSAEEFEQRLRDDIVERQKFVSLTDNNVLFFGEGESKDTIQLHIGPAMTLRKGELLRSVKKGLGSLTQHLETDPDLHDVKTVEMNSKIVAQKPALFERFGLTLAPQSPDSEYRQASIGKEELAARVAHWKHDDNKSMPAQ